MVAENKTVDKTALKTVCNLSALTAQVDVLWEIWWSLIYLRECEKPAKTESLCKQLEMNLN